MRRSGAAGLLVGILLVLLGAVFLLLQLAPGVVPDVAVGRYGWPLVVVVVGLVLVAVGITTRGGAGLCIPGSIVTAAGLVLLVQNTFDLFATWAYAWTLVALVGIGVGLLLQGAVTDQRRLREAGLRLVGVGSVLFLLGALFFEGILHLSGLDLGLFGRLLLPLLLIAVGVFLLVRNRLPALKR